VRWRGRDGRWDGGVERQRAGPFGARLQHAVRFADVGAQLVDHGGLLAGDQDQAGHGAERNQESASEQADQEAARLGSQADDGLPGDLADQDQGGDDDQCPVHAAHVRRSRSRLIVVVAAPPV